MAELDGVWDVRRTGGMLPPLLAVRKRIRGPRGRTAIGSLPGVPFRIRGLELHYEAPFNGFVDVLAPDGDGFRGRATFRGREFGRFDMRRVEGETMAEESIDQQLIKHIQEAHAMEQNVLRMLDGMISTTDDPEIRQELEHHKQETQQHADRMRERLEAKGEDTSKVRDVGGMMQALMKGVMDMARTEKAGRNARDGYATEHLEIASYQLLERIATMAGDEQTAEAARRNRADEEAMAEKIAAHWDKFARLSLEESGVAV
jgi:ferritin-like metal-binding protein YciE